jgi:hypothetical protein
VAIGGVEERVGDGRLDSAAIPLAHEDAPVGVVGGNHGLLPATGEGADVMRS